MNVVVRKGSIVDAPVDAIVVNLFQGVKRPGGATGAVDKALGGLISELIASGEIRGKLNEFTLIHTQGKIPPRRVAVVGLGEREKFDLYRVQQVSGTAARELDKRRCRRVATIVHGAGVGGIDPPQAARMVADGAIRATFRLDTHKTKKDDDRGPFLEELIIYEVDEAKARAMRPEVRRGAIIAEAANWARWLANEPANVMTPARLASEARKMAREVGLSVSVLTEKQMAERKMNLLLAVGQGSAHPPRLIVLRYNGGRRGDPPLAFVGKGVTFDTGGVSLKSREGMEQMKADMAGAAAVLGAMRAIAQLKPRLNVIGIAPAVENAVDGAAYRPGDVLVAANGKTVEVISTDAEGRMILADALHYAVEQKAERIVDVATLTGGILVTLGPVATGIMGNDQQFIDQVIAAGEAQCERMWPLPLFPEYDDLMDSEIADLKNAAGRNAHSIQGAIFLREFVGEAKWVHLDIASTDYQPENKPYLPKGETGVAVRTLVELAQRLAG